MPLRVLQGLALLPLLFAACDDGAPRVDPGTPVERTIPLEELDQAIERAQALFDRGMDNLQVCLFLGAVRRRHGLEGFEEAASEYDRLRKEAQPVPDFRALRRILFPETTFERDEVPTLTDDVNRIFVPALYCDRFTAPLSYRRELIAAEKKGGYYLTHVGLALIFLESLGCESPFPDPAAFRERVCLRMAELLQPGDGVTDLELEAAAFLLTMGRHDLVDDVFLETTLRHQLPDGGWAFESPIASNWHASAMGLWTLLEVRNAGRAKVPLIVSGD